MKQEIKRFRATLALPGDNSEDPVFLRAISQIFHGLVEQAAPEELHLIKIKNWFDHKWLRFAGATRVAGIGVEEAFSDKALPPFTPNRVLAQHGFRQTAKGLRPAQPLYIQGKTHSSGASQRLIPKRTRSGLFVWYSSKSKVNGRGCVMVITVKDHLVQRWYASFEGLGEWRLGKVRGCDEALVSSLLADWPDGSGLANGVRDVRR